MNDETQKNTIQNNETQNNKTQNDGIENNQTNNQELQDNVKQNEKQKMTAIIIQTMVIVILIAGGLWLVCGRSWRENAAGNATENITEDTGQADSTEEDSFADTEEDESEGEESGQEVTVISVLGKEKLVIENDRLQESNLKMIDNMFTLEEINTILSTVKGTWEVEQVVGVISFNDYWKAYLPEMTEAEGQRQYYEVLERTGQDKMTLPDFTVSIKERNTSEGGIVDMEENYVYVRTKDGVNYDSPMSVVLGVGPFQNLQRLADGEDESLSIYIQFFSILDSEEGSNETKTYAADGMIPYMSQEKSGRSYEPATLILTPEGEFLLYKDGIFYSLKPTIQSEIMRGNFEHLEGKYTEYVAEHIAERYSYWKEEGEWRQLDLNGDGIEDLILQYKAGDNDWEQLRIAAIFACDRDSAHCILVDLNDMSEYYFCGPTGELMYTAPHYGMYTDAEPYQHCYYDRDWNLIEDYCLVIYRIDMEQYMEEYPQNAEEWRQANPNMAESGVYFWKRTDTGEEALTQTEFTKIYETVTGLTLYSDFFD